MDYTGGQHQDIPVEIAIGNATSLAGDDRLDDIASLSPRRVDGNATNANESTTHREHNGEDRRGVDNSASGNAHARGGGDYDHAPTDRAPPGHGGITRGRRLFVGNLSYQTRTPEFEAHFAKLGKVTFAQVKLDGMTQQSRGFGVVEFETVAEAQHAMDTLNQVELDGRLLFLREDRSDREVNPDAARDFGRHARRYVERVRADPYASYGDSRGGGARGSSRADSYYGAPPGYYEHDMRVSRDSRGARYGESPRLALIDPRTGALVMADPRMLYGRYDDRRAPRDYDDRRAPRDYDDRRAPRDYDAPPSYGYRSTPSRYSSGVQLFAGNLAPDVTWQQLKPVFERHGNVLRCDVIYDSAGLYGVLFVFA
jgi:RNA recognition motif-containing protein